MMELLAPAGTMEALEAAVKCGADAVYVGGKKFSARSGAKNFDDDELHRAVKYCHLHGVKIHIAANILIKPEEVEAFMEYLGFLNEISVDAVIIQDIGMAALARKYYPDLPLHASTQMTAASCSGVKYLEKMGFERIVLARELSKEEIAYICRNSSAEIEVFAHGAVCMSYSGQCLMSSIIGGRSGNRGMCAQPCRLPYNLNDKNGYLLSTKDMSLIEHLDELKECGVDSIKLEGRLKRCEYTAVVTGIYRKYIDKGGKINNEDKELLKDAFSRSGFSDKYFTNSADASMMSYRVPGNTAENKYLGKIQEFYKRERKIKVNIFCKMRQGEQLYIELADENGALGCAKSENIVEKAINKAVTRERLVEQVSKLGDSVFCAKNIVVEIDEGSNIAVKEINAARRRAQNMLEQKLLERAERRKKRFYPSEFQEGIFQKELTAQVSSKEQLKACEDMGIKTIFLPLSLTKYAQNESAEYAIVLPSVCDNEKCVDIPDGFGVLISNFGQIEQYKHANKYLNYRMNIFNSYSAELFDDCKTICLSPELNVGELGKIKCAVLTECVVYGRLPLMTMKNCPVKNLSGRCLKGKSAILTDRKNEKFIFSCDGACHSILLNSKNIYMADRMNTLLKTGISRFRMMFFDENYEETQKIILDYKKALSGENVPTPPENTFTRAHFFRGVK